MMYETEQKPSPAFWINLTKWLVICLFSAGAGLVFTGLIFLAGFHEEFDRGASELKYGTVTLDFGTNGTTDYFRIRAGIQNLPNVVTAVPRFEEPVIISTDGIAKQVFNLQVLDFELENRFSQFQKRIRWIDFPGKSGILITESYAERMKDLKDKMITVTFPGHEPKTSFFSVSGLIPGQAFFPQSSELALDLLDAQNWLGDSLKAKAIVIKLWPYTDADDWISKNLRLETAFGGKLINSKALQTKELAWLQKKAEPYLNLLWLQLGSGTLLLVLALLWPLKGLPGNDTSVRTPLFWSLFWRAGLGAAGVAALSFLVLMENSAALKLHWQDYFPMPDALMLPVNFNGWFVLGTLALLAGVSLVKALQIRRGNPGSAAGISEF